MTNDDLRKALEQLVRDREVTDPIPRAQIWDELQAKLPAASRGPWSRRRLILGALAIAASLLVVAVGLGVRRRADHHGAAPAPMSVAARAVVSRHLARSDSMMEDFHDAVVGGTWNDQLTARARDLELATRRIQGERLVSDSGSIGLLADVDFVLTEITGYGDLTTSRIAESEMIDYSIQTRQVVPRLRGFGRLGRVGLRPANARERLGQLERFGSTTRLFGARLFGVAVASLIPRDVHAATLADARADDHLDDHHADSLYRDARASLARREYHAAADRFARVASGNPGASVAGNALYWRGYALYASGLARGDSTDLRSALEALHSEAQVYPEASTTREGHSLLARVVAAQATLGDAPAIHALAAATIALAHPLSCDDRNFDLRLVALERLVDREHEDAMPEIERVLATSGGCTEEVRRVAVTVIINTPTMDGMDDLASVAPALYDVQTLIPIRPLGPIVTRAKEPFTNILQIRVLSDGRVLVNDDKRKRLVLLDSSLARVTVVADTTSGTAKAYGASGGGLLAYYGDSSLFADLASLSMLVIEPSGKINRVIAAPRGDAGGLGYTVIPSYAAAFDGVGRVVSKWPSGGGASGGGPGGVDVQFNGGRGIASMSVPSARDPLVRDTQPIVRIDIATLKGDTVAWLMAPPSGPPLGAAAKFGFIVGGIGGQSHVYNTAPPVRNPLPVSDDWAVMADGTIAVVRELTYRIDWIAPNGTRTSSPTIAHGWEHITDSMKVAIIDSLVHVDSVNRAQLQAQMDSTAAANKTVPIPVPFKPFSMDPSALPDYFPPFTGVGNVKVDAENRLWIHVNQLEPLAGGPVYDVVNRSGELVDRVQIPGGTTIMGFGRGVVYLSAKEGTGMSLVRARIR